MQVSRPIGFFVHHQGRGHIARCCALVDALGALDPKREIVIFCARTEGFDTNHPRCRVVCIPDFHGEASATHALHRQPMARALDCAPLGVSALRVGMSQLSSWLGEADPALLVVDVSSEVAILARICSVPVVLVRLHGDRDDPAHESAHTSAVGILAPFDERLEQDDWPARFRDKTFYSGGLVRHPVPVIAREEARRMLAVGNDTQYVVVISGDGGGGANLASLSMGARAIPCSEWRVLGKVRREGHETAFHNLHCLGWVSNLPTYLNAADIVIISPGDSLVHEVATVGKPMICVPEWCYFNEQQRKAQALDRLGVAVHAEHWPGSFCGWQRLMTAASQCDLGTQQSLVEPQAAERSARYIESLATSLWSPAPEKVA